MEVLSCIKTKPSSYNVGSSFSKSFKYTVDIILPHFASGSLGIYTIYNCLNSQKVAYTITVQSCPYCIFELSLYLTFVVVF
jgi:hypothetical protein